MPMSIDEIDRPKLVELQWTLGDKGAPKVYTIDGIATFPVLLLKYFHYRATLCINAVFAVIRCRPSVRLSVTFMFCIQTAEDIVKLVYRPGTPIITLRCNRSCLFVVCLWVCVFVFGPDTTITRNCVHRSSPNWVYR